MAEDGFIPSDVDESTSDTPKMGHHAPEINHNWQPIGRAANSVLASVLEAMAQRQREEIARARAEREGEE